jgi:GT2 family glycosyltransferase
VAPSLSVVVPASDARDTLAATLAALRPALHPEDELHVVRTGAGPAAARNAGALLASREVLVFVDSDVAVHADAFDRIRAAFADPGLDALFGSYDDAPAADPLVSRFRNLLHHHVHQQAPGPATTFWSGLGAIRRRTFAAVDGFDTELCPHAMEDVELGMRLHARGARIVLDPALLGTHLKRWTLREMVRTDVTRRGVPWVRILLRRRELSSALNLGPRHRLTVAMHLLATAVLAAAHRRGALLLLALVVAVNHRFYALLLRRGGPRLAGAGVVLHLVHDLAAAVSVPLGIAAHLLDRERVPAAPAAAPHAEELVA